MFVAENVSCSHEGLVLVPRAISKAQGHPPTQTWPYIYIYIAVILNITHFRSCNSDTCCAARLLLLIHPATSPGTTPALAVVQAQDSNGYSPLMEAAAQGHLAVVKQLLRAHADTALLNKVCSCETIMAVRAWLFLYLR